MQKRNTIQRLMTFETVQHLANHPTADEVYLEIIKKIPSISRATVYRNLNELVDSGKLIKVQTTDGADHFDHNCHRHYHAKCTVCGAVYDVMLNNEVSIMPNVINQSNFTVTGFDLVFKGLCSKHQK